MDTQIVIVAHPSRELNLALDAQDSLRTEALHFSDPADAAATLLASSRRVPVPPIGVIFIELAGASPGVVELVSGLRGDPATARIPIVVWGSAESYRQVSLENGFRPNSFAQTVADSRETTLILAQTIHYWAVVNRSPDSPTGHRTTGGRA